MLSQTRSPGRFGDNHHRSPLGDKGMVISLRNRRCRVSMLIIVLISSVMFCQGHAFAQEKTTKYAPNRYGMGISIGNSYGPENDITFTLLSGFALFDYEKIWGHKVPEALRFKVEGSIGNTTRPDKKLMTSMNIFALYYIKALAFKSVRPYIEGGIGIIYTDFQVEGQGLRFNFNPQAGIGAEFNIGADATFFAALRAHHISNGGLNHDNTGINSVTLTLGRFF
ncbi:MAG: acyloxyacyl hydrolase [Syntrophus sp. (in: bacteria)]|nr:acyloxyacyl hydrolase [Syntrophus sp. (in: bacteria)]